jgi:hypothetical protein
MGKNSRGRFEVSYRIQEETLYWLSDTESTVYSLLMEAPSVHPEIKLSEREGQIEVYQNQTKIVGYQVDVKNPPKGINPAFKRSGYLHPVNTPKGKRLTQIQPKDHYHHYGIWNPWTHTLFEGDTLDFWNLAKEEGTVRFAKLLKKESGAVFSEFKVLQEHVVLKNSAEKVALNETQHIKVIPINQNQYLMDFTIQYECATEQPFTILKYRYAGFGWRTTEEWDNQNSRVLSSDGKNEKNCRRKYRTLVYRGWETRTGVWRCADALPSSKITIIPNHFAYGLKTCTGEVIYLSTLPPQKQLTGH